MEDGTLLVEVNSSRLLHAVRGTGAPAAAAAALDAQAAAAAAAAAAGGGQLPGSSDATPATSQGGGAAGAQAGDGGAGGGGAAAAPPVVWTPLTCKRTPTCTKPAGHAVSPLVSLPSGFETLGFQACFAAGS